MKKYTTIIIVTFLIFASLTVVFGLRSQPIDALIKPPEQNEKGNNVKNILSEEFDKGYILKSPSKGNYRSAVIYYDFDNDKNDEAIVFCSNKKKTESICMLVFKYESNKWTKISTLDSMSTNVIQVDFSDLDSDGVSELIVGWGSFENTLFQKLAVYKIGEDKLNCIFEKNYSDFLVLQTDLIIFNKKERSTSYSVDLYRINKNRFSVFKVFLIDPSISSISQILTENIGIMSNRIYIDGVTFDGLLVTDVIEYNSKNNQFQRIQINGLNISAITKRKCNFLSSDLNEDKIPEIPIQSIDSHDNVIEWVDIINNETETIEYHYDFSEIGCILKISDDDFSRFSIRTDKKRNTLSVYDKSNNDLLFEVLKYDDEIKNVSKSFRYLTSNRFSDLYYRITSKGTFSGITKKDILNSIQFY